MVEWFDLNNGLVHQVNAGGEKKTSHLKTGPDGFCVFLCPFSGKSKTTEVPNLILGGVKKKPAAAAMKKPAAAEVEEPSGAEEEEEEEEEEQDEEEFPCFEEEEKEEEEKEEVEEEEKEDGPEEKEEVKETKKEASPAKGDPPHAGAVKKRYTVMYYKNNNSVGIRQCFLAKRQIAAFGGKSCKKSREELMAVGKQVVEKLEQGLLMEAEVKTWATAQL